MDIVFITDYEGGIFKEKPQLVMNLFRRWIVVIPIPVRMVRSSQILDIVNLLGLSN